MKRKKKPLHQIPWTPFGRATVSELIQKVAAADEVWVNSRYHVCLKWECREEGAEQVHLSIRDCYRSAAHDWRDFQRIKNELLGPEWEGVELYPAESRLVDGANQFHMWAIKQKFPFGFAERSVSEGGWQNSKQRNFEPDARPEDCMTSAQANALVESFIKKAG